MSALRRFMLCTTLLFLFFSHALAQENSRADDLYDTALEFYDVGDYELAIALWSKVIALDPDDVDAYSARASAYLRLENYDAAYLDYLQAAKLDTSEASGLGYIHFMREEYEQSFREYSRAMAADPDDAVLFYWLGRNHYERGDLRLALHYLRRALELDPSDSYSYAWIGQIHYDSNEYAQAIDPLTRAAELAVDNIYILSDRGLAYWHLNLLEKALVDINAIIKSDDTLSYAHTNRGIIYAEMGLYELAQADYNRAIALDPMNANAYYNRGVNYEDLMLEAQGEADYRQAIALDPNFGLPYLALAANYIARGDYGRGQSHYDRFMELTGGVVEPQHVDTKRYVEENLLSAQENTFNLRNVAIIVLVGIAAFLLYRIRQTTNSTGKTRYRGR